MGLFEYPEEPSLEGILRISGLHWSTGSTQVLYSSFWPSWAACYHVRSDVMHYDVR